MTVEANVPITMDDGVVLNANIGFPTNPATGERASGRFPVLLTQDPYTFETQPDPYYVDRGYIFVTAETRGTGTSGGDFGFFSARDAKDGVDLVNFVAHDLSGSNGVVGLTGCSFLGISQMFTAAAIGPNSPIKAIVPACTGHQYDGLYFVGGIGSQNAAQFAGGGSAAIFGTANLAQTTQFLGAVGTSITNGGDDAYNRQFWQQRTSANAAAGVVRNGIPALLWSGWQAEDLIGGLETYTRFQNAYDHRPLSGPMDVHQTATGRYQMIVGNGSHGQGLDEGIELEWYDTWLKGEHTNIKDTGTPLHLFEQGSNRWVNASTLPMDARYTPYYLNAGGALTAKPSNGHGGGDSVVWASPTTAGASLTYTTEPLAKGATLAGPIDASVYASSSNSNLELIADLYDVAPDGTATRVTTGDILGSLSTLDTSGSWYDENHRLTFPSHPYLADHYVPAGQTQRYDMWLYPRLYALAPGHSLRLVVSTQARGEQLQRFWRTAVDPAPAVLPHRPSKADAARRCVPGRPQPAESVIDQPPLTALRHLPDCVERGDTDQPRCGRVLGLGTADAPQGTPRAPTLTRALIFPESNSEHVACLRRRRATQTPPQSAIHSSRYDRWRDAGMFSLVRSVRLGR